MDKINLKGIVKTQDDYMREMFGETSNGITELSVFDLEEYKDQPFRPYSQEKLEQLAEDIKENGVLSPIIVRKMKSTENSSLSYQILAGHNRVNAAKLIGLEKIPCIIKNDITDEEAAIIMTTTNLNQRDELLASEKAFAYKMKLDAIKHQGERIDLASRQLGEKLWSVKEVSKDTNDSERQIQRFIRLTELITPLLDMVDNKSLSLMAGYNLSFISKEEQELIFDYVSKNKIIPSIIQAENIRKLSSIETITTEKLEDLFISKPQKTTKSEKTVDNKTKPIKIKVDDDIISEHFSGKTKKEIENLINNILEEILSQKSISEILNI